MQLVKSPRKKRAGFRAEDSGFRAWASSYFLFPSTGRGCSEVEGNCNPIKTAPEFNYKPSKLRCLVLL